MTFKIIKRNGDLDIELEDGEYDFKGKITIEDSEIRYIDNGIWTSINRQGKDSFPQEKQLDVVKSQPAVCDKHDIIRRLSEDGFFMDCGDFVKKEVKHE